MPNLQTIHLKLQTLKKYNNNPTLFTFINEIDIFEYQVSLHLEVYLDECLTKKHKLEELEDTYSSCTICGIFRAVGMNHKCTEKDCANGNGLICDTCAKQLGEIFDNLAKEAQKKNEQQKVEEVKVEPKMRKSRSEKKMESLQKEAEE